MVLKDVSFTVKAGERVGVGRLVYWDDIDSLLTDSNAVGRTGSGKSTLTLALLRCIVTEGTVYYDGIATNTINLDALRSNITIIPQVASP